MPGVQGENGETGIGIVGAMRLGLDKLCSNFYPRFYSRILVKLPIILSKLPKIPQDSSKNY